MRLLASWSANAFGSGQGLPVPSASISLSSSFMPGTPAPLAAWYVETTMRVTPPSLWSGQVGTRPMIVAQLGLAMRPLFQATSSALISGTTSGTSGSRRKACELSTTVAPRLTASGRSSLACSSPAAPSTMSMPSKASGRASWTVTSRPFHSILLPAERALASRRSSPTGKSRSARQVSICVPTAPVAPRIATFFVSDMVSPLLAPGFGAMSMSCGRAGGPLPAP